MKKDVDYDREVRIHPKRPLRVSKCGLCRYWETSLSNPEEGWCVFNPPVYVREYEDDDFNTTGQWPKTNFDSWCGKFSLYE